MTNKEALETYKRMKKTRDKCKVTDGILRDPKLKSPRQQIEKYLKVMNSKLFKALK